MTCTLNACKLHAFSVRASVGLEHIIAEFRCAAAVRGQVVKRRVSPGVGFEALTTCVGLFLEEDTGNVAVPSLVFTFGPRWHRRVSCAPCPPDLRRIGTNRPLRSGRFVRRECDFPVKPF